MNGDTVGLNGSSSSSSSSTGVKVGKEILGLFFFLFDIIMSLCRKQQQQPYSFLPQMPLPSVNVTFDNTG
jgi:hypothetical protein